MSQEPEELSDEELEDFVLGLMMQEGATGELVDIEEVKKILKE